MGLDLLSCLLNDFFAFPDFLFPKEIFLESLDLVDFAIICIFVINSLIFICMRITEEERKNILSKYSDNTSDELLRHLKRNYPTWETKLDWMEEPIKYILINDKSRFVKGNKKFLVN